MKPLVSILALTYNQRIFVEEGLSSLAAQTYENLEIIVVDDASTDGTDQWLETCPWRNDPRFTFVFNQENIGIGASLNRALEMAKGRYVSVFASDDILLPEKIEEQVEFFESQTDNVGMVFGDAEIIDMDGKDTHAIDTWYARAKDTKPAFNIFDQLIERNFIFTPTVMLRRDVLEEVGKFTEDLFLEDYDLWLRIAQNYRLVYQAKCLTKYRVHDENNLNHAHRTFNWNEYKILVFRMLYIKSKKLNYQLSKAFYYLYHQNRNRALELYKDYPFRDRIYRQVRKHLETGSGQLQASLRLKLAKLVV